uniref:Fibronectin type-III domain-containing protein n=1 Tax=Hymenolepis diminuta TaxID=6216 RepID=A0A0R3SZ40_HYMDI
LCVYNNKILQRIPFYTKAPSDPTCGNRTADSLSWEFSPINGSNETFWYKIVHPDLTVLGDCDESESKCNATNLSAGTVYTAHLIVCFNDTANNEEVFHRDCNVTEITFNTITVECSIETKRSVSNEALVTTVMAKTVDVDSTSQNCSISNTENSCTIRNLQACTSYSVSLITCLGNINCGDVVIIDEDIRTDKSSNVELITALVVVCAIVVI